MDIVKHHDARAGRLKSLRHRAQAIEILISTVGQYEKHGIRIPGERILIKILYGARRGKPSAFKLTKLNVWIFAGEHRGDNRHKGRGRRPVQVHRVGMADDGDSLRGQRFHLRLERS